MAELHKFTNSAVPLARVEAEALADLFADLQRQCGAALFVLTQRMDEIDGDAESEESDPPEYNGDEMDGTFAEDEWHIRRGGYQGAL